VSCDYASSVAGDRLVDAPACRDSARWSPSSAWWPLPDAPLLGIVIRLFPFRTNPTQRFHKQLAITDFCVGRDRFSQRSVGQSRGWVLRRYMRAGAFPVGTIGARTSTGIYLICIGRICRKRKIGWSRPARRDKFGFPVPSIRTQYRRDLAVQRALYRGPRFSGRPGRDAPAQAD
jgi:hypothetical protein